MTQHDVIAECKEKTEKFHGQCTRLREHVGKLMDACESKQKFDPEFITEGAKIFLDIKESHRDISATQEKLHKTRDDQTHKSDALRLQLQNLQYEAYHLRQKIAQCKRFASRHTEINLVPVEEYNNIVSTDAQMDESVSEEESEHKLMMNRLQHELQSRQDLLKQLEELTKQKTTLETSNQQKKSFLQSLRENLKSYDAINKKINSFMQTEDQNTNDFDTARVLPTPLYVLYNNLLAYQTHFDKTINLRLVGDVKEGREALMSLITNKVDTSIYEQEEEEEDKPEKSTVESPMEDDEVVIEPPKKKIRESVEVSINDSRFKVFPISILLEIPVQHKDGSRTISIRFSFVADIKMIVVAETLNKNESPLLPTLVPNDTGIKSPSALHLSNYDFSSFEAGRPYKWVQWIAGLNHMEPAASRDPGTFIPKLTAATIVKLLRYKVLAEKYLNAQIHELERLRMGTLPKELFEKNFEMTSFALVNSNQNERVYLATFVGQENKVKIECRIKINHHDYPLQPPTFSLSVAQGELSNRNFDIPESMSHLIKSVTTRDRSEGIDICLKDIERDLNELFVYDTIERYRYSEKNESNEEHFTLLNKLMVHLWTCINVYGSVDSNDTKKVAARNHRGRTRQIPTRFNMMLNTFDQT